MDQSINLIQEPVKMAYSRNAEAILEIRKCHITGEVTLCVCVDTSDGEYGDVNISLDYINKRAKELTTI
jgi:hypothetical protein